MDHKDETPEIRYETPEVEDLGAVSDLTLQGKVFGPTDGFTFQGQGISTT